MARFQPRVDLWALDDEARRLLQPGQHVSAGGARGVYLGGTARTQVVAWSGNATGRYRPYLRALRDYARGIEATARAT